MTHDEFNAFCASLPVSSHIVQWGGADVWKVAGKVFAIGRGDLADGPAFTFKTSDSNFHFLSEEPGYRPAPYFAGRGMKWIQYLGSPPAKDEDLKHYLEASHQLVAAGLSRKKRSELGL